MRPWHKNEKFIKKCYYLESHNNIRKRKQTNKQWKLSQTGSTTGKNALRLTIYSTVWVLPRRLTTTHTI